MKKLIILISLILFLTGCTFNLNDFTIPDDMEFLKTIEELDKPLKIANYMEDKFTYKKNLYRDLNPYQLWKIKKGDCADFANFGVFIADYHGIEVYQIRIVFTKIVHQLGVYKENYYSFTDNWAYFNGYSTFKDIVEADSLYQQRNWESYIVYSYGKIIERGKQE